MDEDYSDCFGFTVSELEKLLNRYKLIVKRMRRVNGMMDIIMEFKWQKNQEDEELKQLAKSALE